MNSANQISGRLDLAVAKVSAPASDTSTAAGATVWRWVWYTSIAERRAVYVTNFLTQLYISESIRFE